MTQLSISTSDRSVFKRCRQQWEFSSSLKLYLEPHRPQEPLWFGSMMHKGLAAYYDPQYPNRDADRAIFAYRQECNESFKLFEETNGKLWAEERDKFLEQEALGIDMLTNYCVNLAPQVDDFEVVEVEEIYSVPIGYWSPQKGFAEIGTIDPLESGLWVEVVYTFVVDAIVKRNGKFWILEHKNMAKFSENRRWLLMDDQVGSYIWCVQQKHNIKVEGVLYNTLIKKERKPLKVNKNGMFSTDKRQSVPYADALRAIEESGQETAPYQEFLDVLQQRDELENPWFRREAIRRNQKEIELTFQTIIQEAKMMVNPDVEITRTPSSFNCGGCAFFDPCVAKWEGGDYQFLLDNLYRRKKYRDRAGNTDSIQQ